MRFTSQHKKAYFNTRSTQHKIWLNQDIDTTRLTRLFTQRRSSTRSTQESPQERGQNLGHKEYLKRDIFSANTRTFTREMESQTQELPQERDLQQTQGLSQERWSHKHKSYLNRKISNKPKDFLKREITNKHKGLHTRERSSPYTQELPQERGIHHKHKSFSKNTRPNPRRAPPPQARPREETSTKIIDQKQNLWV